MGRWGEEERRRRADETNGARSRKGKGNAWKEATGGRRLEEEGGREGEEGEEEEASLGGIVRQLSLEPLEEGIQDEGLASDNIPVRLR